MIDILKDIRLGGRLLLKSPGYAIVVAFTLALAIGANTIIFSFADLFLLRPLPLGDPARTVTLYSVDSQRGLQRARTSLPDFLDWRAQTTTFEQMAAYYQTGYTLTGTGDPVRVTALRATANMPSMWQLKTVAGRTFLPGEDAPGAPKVALLSHRFWKDAMRPTATSSGRAHDMNTWWLQGGTDLDKHVGHKIQITGKHAMVHAGMSSPAGATTTTGTVGNLLDRFGDHDERPKERHEPRPEADASVSSFLSGASRVNH